MKFDSKQINYTSERSDLVVLIEKIEKQQIDFFSISKNNSLQKNISKLSQIIETILTDFPLPTFYIHEFKDNTLCPIDNYGYEVLFALKKFVVEKKFKLQDLKYLSSFNGFDFDRLPPERQRKIYWKEIRIYYINKWTPDFIKLDIYKNFNIGGLRMDVLQFDSIKSFLTKFEVQKSSLSMPDKVFLKFMALYFSKYDNSDIDIFVLKWISSIETTKNENDIVEKIEEKRTNIVDIWQNLELNNDDWKLCILIQCLNDFDSLQKAKELSILIRLLHSKDKYTFNRKFKTITQKIKNNR